MRDIALTRVKRGAMLGARASSWHVVVRRRSAFRFPSGKLPGASTVELEPHAAAAATVFRHEFYAQPFERVLQCHRRFAVESGKTGLEQGEGVERQNGLGGQQARLDLRENASGVALLRRDRHDEILLCKTS